MFHLLNSQIIHTKCARIKSFLLKLLELSDNSILFMWNRSSFEHKKINTEIMATLEIKPYSENIAHFKRKFDIDRIVRFWRFQRVWTQKICEIS